MDFNEYFSIKNKPLCGTCQGPLGLQENHFIIKKTGRYKIIRGALVRLFLGVMEGLGVVCGNFLDIELLLSERNTETGLLHGASDRKNNLGFDLQFAAAETGFIFTGQDLVADTAAADSLTVIRINRGHTSPGTSGRHGTLTGDS